MKNIIALIIIFVVILLSGFYIKLSTEKSSLDSILAPNNSGTSLAVKQLGDKPKHNTIPAEKIEVVHFHGSQQCVSCITVGEYALETIKEKFTEEYESGKIVFKDVNGELKENQSIVIKYQARGSSLFVNSIVEEKDNIKEDVTVWRLVNNKDQFKTYFEKKLIDLLGE